jgi:hypothetical protein
MIFRLDFSELITIRQHKVHMAIKGQKCPHKRTTIRQDYPNTMVEVILKLSAVAKSHCCCPSDSRK